MSDEEIENRVWDTWMQDLDNKADKTKRDYLRNFKRFLKRWDITAGELYEMRKSNFQSVEPLERKRIESMVRTSMSEIMKAGFKAATARAMSKGVSSFFESMNMELNLKKKDMPKGESKGQVAISAVQIRKVYEQMVYRFRLRNRALLLTAKDSGLRMSDIAMMDYGYWLQAETIRNEHGEIFKVFDPALTQKMKVIAYVHLGPESVAVIEEYLKDRQDRGEILTEESPLFLSQYGERLNRNAMALTLGLQTRKLKFKRVSAHSLRKFHTTNLEDAGMPANWIKKLQGKKASVYSQPEETGKLTKKYLECYDALRIIEKPMDKRENERLREELERMRAQSPPELTALIDRLENMENRIAEILEANNIVG